MWILKQIFVETRRFKQYFWLATLVFTFLSNGFALFAPFALFPNCIQVHKNITAELLELNREATILQNLISLNCNESISIKQRFLSKRSIKTPFSLQQYSRTKLSNPPEQIHNYPFEDSENKHKSAECSDLKKNLSLIDSTYLEKQYRESMMVSSCQLKTVEYLLCSLLILLGVTLQMLMVPLFPGLPPEFLRYRLFRTLDSQLMRISQNIQELAVRYFCCLDFF